MSHAMSLPKDKMHAATPFANMESMGHRMKQIEKKYITRYIDMPPERHDVPAVYHVRFQVFLITKGSSSYLSSPCFSKNVLQSGVGIVH